MEGPELLGRGGRPACDYPTCLYCVGRERRGVSSTRRYSTISEGWEYDSTSAAVWTGTSERSDGGVRAGGTKAPGGPCIGGPRIFAGYAHSVDSNAPGEWCVE